MPSVVVRASPQKASDCAHWYTRNKISERFSTDQSRSYQLGVVVHVCDPRAWEVGAGRSGVQSHPELHRELGAILGYTRLRLKGWRVGSVVKIAYRSFRGPEFGPQHLDQQFTTTSNSVSKETGHPPGLEGTALHTLHAGNQTYVLYKSSKGY